MAGQRNESATIVFEDIVKKFLQPYIERRIGFSFISIPKLIILCEAFFNRICGVGIVNISS